MIKKLIFVLVIVTSSCTQNSKNIYFKLNNNNLKCLIIKDSIYKSRFATNEDREFSTNVVSLTLKNETKKNLLFLINGNYFNKAYDCKINIYENNKLIKFNLPISRGGIFKDAKKQQKLTNYWNYTCEKERNDVINLIKLGAKENSIFSFESYLDKKLILHPNEKITIKSILQLPYMVENTIFNTMDPVYYDFVENANYEFSLSYEMDAKKLKKIITKEQLEELAYNNVEIYDGKIETQRIPINVIFK